MLSVLSTSGQRPVALSWNFAGIRSIHSTRVARDVSTAPKKTLDPKQLIRKQLRAIGKPSVLPPKRPLTPYVLFANDQSASIRATLNNVAPKERLSHFGRTAGKKWTGLDDTQKQRYERLAEQERENYEKAYKKYLDTRSPADVVLERKIYALKKKLTPTSAAVKRPASDVNAPQPPANWYAVFTKQAFALSPERQRQTFGVPLADVSFGEASKLIAAAYKKLPAEQRQKFKEGYDKAYANYVAERDSYNRSAGIDQIKKEINATTRLAVKVPKPLKRKKAKKLVKTRANKRIVKKTPARRVTAKKTLAKKKTPTAAAGKKKTATKKTTAKKTTAKKAAPKKTVKKTAA